MSLKINVFANYASQIYVAAVGILILPLYIKYMGAEAYGLVGFFTMLQSWFALLDLGLTPTISRETARYHGGAMSALAYRQLFRSLSLIFAGVAFVGGGSLWLLSELVATRWLQVAELGLDEVVFAVQIMSISVALRWMGGLFRGVITGSERLVWLSGFNALIATLRFVGVFANMWLFGFTPSVFFIHQLVVALLEVLGLFLVSRRILPAGSSLDQSIGWSFRPIKPFLRFALTIAFTSSVWVLVMQTDKLVLSGILPLSEYGYFTFAVLAASAIMLISAPVSAALTPRLALLYAEGRGQEIDRLYRVASQLVTAVTGAVALVLVFLAEPLLLAWTGSAEVAQKAAPILELYAAGNGLLAISAFPYYLQYAQGNLRMHLIGHLLMLTMLVPAMVLAAIEFGVVGAGYAWLGFNSLYFLFWVPVVHRYCWPGMHARWMLKDILPVLVPMVIVGVFFAGIDLAINSHLLLAVQIGLISALVLLAGALGSSWLRAKVLRRSGVSRG